MTVGAFSSSKSARDDSYYLNYGYENKSSRHSLEKHNLIKKAFKEKDYKTWRTLVERSGRDSEMLDTINENNFDKFAEAHNFSSRGHHGKALRIHNELGIKNRGRR